MNFKENHSIKSTIYLYILLYLITHELYNMYVKMHSQSSPLVNTGTLPVVHNLHQKRLIYSAFFLWIYLLACRNLLWDILRLLSSRRAALGLYVILTLCRRRGANQPPYALLRRSSPRYALRHGRLNILCICCCISPKQSSRINHGRSYHIHAMEMLVERRT